MGFGTGAGLGLGKGSVTTGTEQDLVITIATRFKGSGGMDFGLAATRGQGHGTGDGLPGDSEGALGYFLEGLEGLLEEGGEVYRGRGKGLVMGIVAVIGIEFPGMGADEGIESVAPEVGELTDGGVYMAG
jgi:hypothetical protein